MPDTRWKPFSDIIDNPRENINVSIYRPTFIKDPLDRTSKESIALILDTVSLWLYPEEELKQFIDGKIAIVEGIFLFKPIIRPELNDLLLRRGDKKLYRVIGIRDMISHKEVHVMTSDKSNKFLTEAFYAMSSSPHIADKSSNSMKASVTII